VRLVEVVGYEADEARISHFYKWERFKFKSVPEEGVKLEITERVGKLEIAQARTEERLDNLEGWQKSQNGTIKEVNKKVDKLQYWIMGVMAAALGSLFVNLFK